MKKLLFLAAAAGAAYFAYARFVAPAKLGDPNLTRGTQRLTGPAKELQDIK